MSFYNDGNCRLTGIDFTVSFSSLFLSESRAELVSPATARLHETARDIQELRRLFSNAISATFSAACPAGCGPVEYAIQDEPACEVPGHVIDEMIPDGQALVRSYRRFFEQPT